MSKRARRRARSEERNEEIRRQLQPLAPGERPGAVTVAALVAATLGLANLALLVAGVDVQGDDPAPTGVILFSLIMFAAAVGMWRAKYWAVLGFQALLGLGIVIGALSLAVASNTWAVVGCLLVIGLSGWLFWKLVRAMARLQMPAR